ncbi:6-bladed beta-propeller [Pedobacter jeongneungensis]
MTKISNIFFVPLMTNRLLLVFFFLLEIGKSFSQQVTIDTTNVTLLRIAPETAMGGNAALFIDKVNYIPLQTSKESEFGSITQLEVTDSFFIILDQATNSVLLFDRMGNFYRKIQTKGLAGQLGYGEQFKQICVDQTKKQILIRTRNQNHTLVYDFEANLIQTIKTDLIKGEFAFFDNGKAIVNSTGYDYNDELKKYDQFWLNKNQVSGKLSLWSHLKKLDSRDILTPDQFYYQSGDHFFSTNTYSYNIFRIGSDSISLAYQFLFPQENSLPKDFLINKSLEYKRINYLRDHSELIYSVTNFFKVGDNLMFKLQSGKSNDFDDLVFNLKSQRLIAMKKITPDSVSQYLTIAQPSILGTEYSNHGIQKVFGKNIYTSYSALELFTSKSNSEETVRYDDKLKKFFAAKNDHANPVIVEITLKSDL